MKPKRTYKTSLTKPAARDLCQTPPYAVVPLLYFIDKRRGVNRVVDNPLIWEPACGHGLLANALRVAGFRVIETDIDLGQNFFEYQPPKWDMIITNPPFGIKPAWTAHCYELGKPFALLMPTEFQGTIQGGELFEKYGVEIIDLRPRVDFKMPNEGWFSNAQFPVSWYCHDVLLDDLIFEKLHKPKRTVSRQVWKKGKLVTEWGYADWIENPTKFNFEKEQFEYKEE
jgi:hypothetical protein